MLTTCTSPHLIKPTFGADIPTKWVISICMAVSVVVVVMAVVVVVVMVVW
jgi:hypothetical protein